jgi:hypothetical protein
LLSMWMDNIVKLRKVIERSLVLSTKMVHYQEDQPASENKLSQTDIVDAEPKRKVEPVVPVDNKKINKSFKGKKSKTWSSSSAGVTDQAAEDAKAKLKGSRQYSNAASATNVSSGPAFIDNDVKPRPAPSQDTAKVKDPDKVSKARAARPPAQPFTSSSAKMPTSAIRSVADDEAKAKARNRMVASRVQSERGKAKPKVSSSEQQLATDEEVKVSARNRMVPSRVRRSGVVGDNELSAASVMEATVFPVVFPPPAIENEEDDSILPGAQKVRGPCAKLEANLNFDDLEAPPSKIDYDAPAPDNDNLEHATAIVAELAPTDLDVSAKLQKMVEDRFNQERKRQVVVEAIQAEPMGNDEQGDNICGVIVSKKCWLLLVVGLLVLVAVAVGAGVLGAAAGGDSGSSDPPKPPPPGGDNDDNDDNDGPEEPTAAPSISRRVELLAAIGATIVENEPDALTSPATSPQGKALDWLAYADEANLDLTTVRPSVLVERYALAVLYFGTNGPTSWTNRYGFLNASSVCSWYEDLGSDSYNGVSCQDGISVNALRLGKHLCGKRESDDQVNLIALGLQSFRPCS